jgi:exodeoxyribonuclease VIII
MSIDISIDLETLSNKFNSPILSIGAVKFDRVTGEVGQTFYVEIDPDDAIRHGLVSGSTLAWWVKQDAKARRVFEPSNKKVQLKMGLQMLGDFVRARGAGAKPWGNGSSFDITVLEHAYEVAGMGLQPQWKFWDIRDMRTIIDVAESMGFVKARLIEGIAHNALDDAVHQAKEIARAFAHITGKKQPVSVVATSVDDDEL